MKKYTNIGFIALAFTLMLSLSACGSAGTAPTQTAPSAEVPAVTAEAPVSEAPKNTTPIYKAGTYSATAQGMGEVKVEITVDEYSITAMVVDVSNETQGIGAAQGEPLKAQIMEAQSADIDGVSGSTVTSTAVKEAAADCLAQAAK